MKGYKHLTADQKAAILESFARTKTTTVTAREVSATNDQVRHYLKSQGIEPTKAQERSRCFQQDALVRQLAAEGLSLSEIATRIGTNRHRLKAYIERHEIPYEPFQQTGSNNPAWKGGRMTDKHGYILILRPDHPYANRHGYVREHRLVMEKVLGRYLEPSEVVHHIDGNRAHNAPENLEVHASNAEHLAETLKGRTPEWSPDGIAAMQANGSRVASRLRRSSLGQLLPDGQASQGTEPLTSS